MSTPFLYMDRAHAGRVLAKVVQEKLYQDPVVLALPRGGVPIAKEISELLKVSLDVLIVRKIGAPFNQEYGIGAMCEDLVPLFSAPESLLEQFDEDIPEIVEKEKIELKRRIKLYRGLRPLPEVKDKSVILVDDGLATGVTATAAAKFLKAKGAKKIILAVPVGPQIVSKLLKTYVDEVICPLRPANLSGVGMWYRDFEQVSDEEVISVLKYYHPESENEIQMTI